MWDHWECGHHYSRPMSSWTTLTAALGLQIDAANKTLRLSPAFRDVTLPLCVPGFLGTVEVRNGAVAIDPLAGSLDGWSVLTAPACPGTSYEDGQRR